MTKEELKKEAEEYRESKRHKSFRADVGTVQINYESYLNNLQQAYLAGAEPREKRIADLEAQIEKMKCCQNCKHCNEIISYKVLGGKEISKICSDGNYVCDKWEIKEK